MNRASSNHLARISNCLQTILDLEPALEKIEIGKSLLEEFSVLKEFLQKIETVSLNEDDVKRVEIATSNFLEELRVPLAQARNGRLAAPMLQ